MTLYYYYFGTQFSHGWACTVTAKIQCWELFDWGLCSLPRITIRSVPDHREHKWGSRCTDIAGLPCHFHDFFLSNSYCLLEYADIVSFLFLQLLVDNISRPAPNITHLLLKFDLDSPIERTVLQPKFHYRFS